MTQEIVLQNNKRLCECGCGQEILELISKHRGESKQAADRYIKLYKDRINNRLVAGRKSKTRLKLQAFELDSTLRVSNDITHLSHDQLRRIMAEIVDGELLHYIEARRIYITTDKGYIFLKKGGTD